MDKLSRLEISKTKKVEIQKAMNAKKVLSQSASLKRLTICSIPFLCFCINGMWVLLSLTKSQQIWQIRLFFRSEEGVVVVVLLLWTSCNWMRKFCLSIESKVECNQKMKLPQGLNNLHGRINHPTAAEEKSDFTNELSLPGRWHIRAWTRGEGARRTRNPKAWLDK